MYSLASSLISSASKDIGVIVRRTRRKAVLSALAGGLFTAASLAALLGLGFWLAEAVGPIAASFIIAGVLAALALSVMAILSVVNHLERRQNRQSATAKALVKTASAATLPLLLKTNRPLVLALVGGIAFLAARAGSER